MSNVIFLIVGQLFSQRQSFFKLATIRCTKDSRASYCLACLISLVEQVIGLFIDWLTFCPYLLSSRLFAGRISPLSISLLFYATGPIFAV